MERLERLPDTYAAPYIFESAVHTLINPHNTPVKNVSVIIPISLMGKTDKLVALSQLRLFVM